MAQLSKQAEYLMGTSLQLLWVLLQPDFLPDGDAVGEARTNFHHTVAEGNLLFTS